ncbi:haloacid dehalogenase [Stenotrophomonas koreensis]|uniref:Enolase-phosphatase E1 n=1 Tax=Stenotrophomonas koreensis TaxID=266128 RepID=A0A0R0C2A4_9GAMM|nr:acireductone synthase [Stenotrophomonas koreensis]KRG59796.1 haloacid dehalogenase [Stenotrophomonas koreensis]
MTAPRIILTDIEGTTSSISFVKNVLFPYARAALPGFVATHGQQPAVRRWLDAVATEIAASTCDDAVIVETLQGWIDADRKHTALKALQGMIWEAGYRNGDYTAHLYPEVADVLRRWHAAGLPLYVYSSGSVAAQKLFFGFSDAGDLGALFAGHFDTEIGGKREADSYRRITAALGAAPAQILFLSDVVQELDAAREAGLDTVLLDRLDDYPTPRSGEAANGHTRVTDFTQIQP